MSQTTMLDLERARLSRYRTVVAQFRGALDMRFNFLNPVEVISGEKRVGWAALERNGWIVYANIVLDYSTPERLDVENHDQGAPKVYARLNGLFEMYSGGEFMGLFSDALEERISDALVEVNVFSIVLDSKPSWEDQPALGKVVL